MNSTESVYEVGNRRVHAIAEGLRKVASGFTAFGVALIGVIHATNFAPGYPEAIAGSIYSVAAGVATYAIVHTFIDIG